MIRAVIAMKIIAIDVFVTAAGLYGRFGTSLHKKEAP